MGLGLNRRRECGFTLIEVLVGTVVLTIALLGLLAMLAQAIAVADFGEDALIAKQKAREALESIYTARNTNQISFSMIRGVNDGGIFAEGYQPLTTAGSDGLLSTADDGAVEVMRTAGPDGMMGTGDDDYRTLDGFERRVLVQDVNEDMRKVTVTVRYPSANGVTRVYELSTLISRFR